MLGWSRPPLLRSRGTALVPVAEPHPRVHGLRARAGVIPPPVGRIDQVPHFVGGHLVTQPATVQPLHKDGKGKTDAVCVDRLLDITRRLCGTDLVRKLAGKVASGLGQGGPQPFFMNSGRSQFVPSSRHFDDIRIIPEFGQYMAFEPGPWRFLGHVTPGPIGALPSVDVVESGTQQAVAVGEVVVQQSRGYASIGSDGVHAEATHSARGNRGDARVQDRFALARSSLVDVGRRLCGLARLFTREPYLEGQGRTRLVAVKTAVILAPRRRVQLRWSRYRPPYLRRGSCYPDRPLDRGAQTYAR